MDLELPRLPPGRMDQINSFGDVIDGSSVHSDGTVQPSGGPENWPVQVLNQQQRQLPALLQKLYSIYIAVFIQIL